MIHSPDLHTVLRRFDEFTDVLRTCPRFTVTPRGQHRLQIDVSGLDDPEHLVTDFALAVGHRFTSWLIGKRIKLSAVELPYPEPPEAADYDRVSAPCRPSTRRGGSDVRQCAARRAGRPRRERPGRLPQNSPGDLLSRRDYGSTMATRSAASWSTR